MRISYFHKFVGRHEFPVTLHIKVDSILLQFCVLIFAPPISQKGKQITLRLVGDTTDLPPPHLNLSWLPVDPPLAPSSATASAAADSSKQPTDSSASLGLSLADVNLVARHHAFEPLPLGLHDSELPLQTFPLINDSPYELGYKLDLTALEKAS